MTYHYEDDTVGEQQFLDQEARQQMAEAEAEDIMGSCIDPYAAERLVIDSEFLAEDLTSITVWLAYLRINRNNKGAVADGVDGLLAIFEAEALRTASFRVEGREIENGNPYED
jgi:hypothetical protein